MTVYDAFGVFGAAPQEKIGIFHSSFLSKDGPENSKHIVDEGAEVIPHVPMRPLCKDPLYRKEMGSAE